MNSTKKGDELESFVHYVYESLLKLNEDRNAKIYRKHSLVGNTGASHEFDIFYEFDYLGTHHRVAIECKNHEKAVPMKEVTDFAYKIGIIKNVTGIMISKNGYQDGANKVGNFERIRLLTTKELPSFFKIFDMKLRVMIPDETVKGDPFWVLMQINPDGDNLGIYASDSLDSVFLFQSWKIAKRFSICFSEEFEVRGLTQSHLNILCNLLKSQNKQFNLISYPFRRDLQNVNYVSISPDEIASDFLE